VGVGAEGVGAGLPVEFPGVFEAELPGLVLDVEPAAALLPESVEPAENGFAAPDPQPTTDAMAATATLNLINTLDNECTLNPQYELQLTETTVGLHLLWLHQRRTLGEVGKIPRLF
jgi:hypothetical protein